MSIRSDLLHEQLLDMYGDLSDLREKLQTDEAVTVRRGPILMVESSYERKHELKITLSRYSEYDDGELLMIASRIVADYDQFGWDDTDAVEWTVNIDNGSHSFRPTISIVLEDYMS